MQIANFLPLFQLVTLRHWRPIFIAMVVLFHLAAVIGPESYLGRVLMLAHFGLFIMWQPFMRGDQRMSTGQVLGILLIAILVMLTLNWWLLGLWVSVLAGIVGGKVFLFQAPWLRRFYLVVLLYFVAMLLVWIVPNSFMGINLPAEIGPFVRYGLPLLFIPMALLPVEKDSAETPQIVDFLYATLLFLMLVVLVLGTFAFMSVARLYYLLSLAYTLIIIAGVLLALSLAWNPRGGFGGLAMFFSRYLLSIGLPFEQWLYFLAELSQCEARPEQFLRQACDGLQKLPWVTGGKWRAGEDSGEFGHRTQYSAEFANEQFYVMVYSRHALSPSLIWHFHLLGQLLGEFYLAKLREMKLQQQTYVQAVHETGARVAHDVKNLLQSLNVLTSAAESSAQHDPAELQALMRRQLPAISQRLQATIDKLRRPEMESGRFVRADVWWADLRRSYKGQPVEFEAGAVVDTVLLPKELFDSVADNLIQNAMRKLRLEGGVRIAARFSCADAIEFSVSDTGSMVAPEVLRGLLRGPVPSASGYGIGLYQAARHAEISGFALRLSDNEQGYVRFLLRGDVRRA
jgi:signal transduction histidine kinase